MVLKKIIFVEYLMIVLNLSISLLPYASANLGADITFIATKASVDTFDNCKQMVYTPKFFFVSKIPSINWSDHSKISIIELAKSMGIEVLNIDDKLTLMQPFFGDLHVHTRYSLDASTQGTRTTPLQAYEFARGARLDIQPWTDNGKGVRSLQLDRPLDFAMVTDHAENIDAVAWQATKDAAEQHYDRSADCSFTTFIGYEWTRTQIAANEFGQAVTHRRNWSARFNCQLAGF